MPTTFRDYDPPRSEHHRNWFLTINNYTEEDIKEIEEAEKEVRYAIVCKEVAPTTGTPHMHLTLVYENGRTFASMKKKFKRADIEPCKNLDKAIAYCKEDGDYREIGDRPRKKGKGSSPLTEVAAMVSAGATRREIALAHPVEFMRYHRGIEALMMVTEEQEDRRWEGPYPWPMISDWSYSWVIVGPSGINKSQFAKSHFTPGKVLVCSNIDDLKRFDPKLHEGIIFDDMDFRHYPRTSQIHLVDQDENRTIHNRFTDALIPAGTKKIFTCNEMCLNLGDAAINRRVKVLEVQ